jgi:serine/threonine-protein kinase RsbW
VEKDREGNHSFRLNGLIGEKENAMSRLLKCKVHSMEEFAAIREKIEQLMDRVCSEEVFASFLALNEAVNNAFEHGQKDQNEAVKISICIADNRKMVIRVKDPGQGFIPSAPRTAEECLWDEGGRGRFLMEAMMDKVLYNHRGNSIVMLKKLEG